MRKYQPVDGNATIELREQLFQKVKQRALSLINKAQKENSVYALADLSADLSDLNKKYKQTGDGQNNPKQCLRKSNTK